MFISYGELSFFKDFLPVFHISAKSTLTFTLQKLASVDAHRLWVLDEEDHPVSVITLTDIFHLLNPTLKETSYIG
jgi:predicted transcriptional regulator